jgi:hypothetical protein
MLNSFKKSSFFIRLTNWEYWPFGVVYTPMFFYWIYLCIRSKSFFFFNAANPSIKNGGFLLESKNEIYKIIPEKFYPKTIFIEREKSFEYACNEMKIAGLNFPIILKPDIGLRGMSVEKVDSLEQMNKYIQDTKVDYLIQEYVDLKLEVGIFYCRLPKNINGEITGIVDKELLTVAGDGISTIEELLYLDPRSILQIPILKKTLPTLLKEVLPLNQRRLIVPYGNHSRGAKFIDESHRIDDKLNASIDQIAKSIPGFYFGRMDIRFSSWEELKEGKNFSIIELNGAGSEPTHIYDPKHSIFFAWKEIIRHFNFLYEISKQNQIFNEAKYLTFSNGISMFKENAKYVKLIENKP